MDTNNRPTRKVGIADHIWTAFEDMASQMGSDRDALINQAMFMFARLNGFLDGAGHGSPAGARPAAEARNSPPASAARAPGRGEEDPDRREIAERVLETAAELERMIKNKNAPPPPAPDDQGEEVDGVDMAEEGSDDAGGGGPQLYMMAEGGELDRVSKERFVIGRGKHCDFVINSGKVSREHAVITREGSEYYVEDLGSSNGTWFNKQRIKRRKIEDGDEFFICSEKVKFVFRD